MFCFSVKLYLPYIWVEPVLNHEMVRAVLTERQTRDCDIKCHITFSFQWNDDYAVHPSKTNVILG